jgi:hypothetical protein
MNARVVGALGVTAVAAIAAGMLLAPVAQSGSDPGLKMTTTNSERVQVPPMGHRTVTAKCPRAYHATGIGQDLSSGLAITSEKRSARIVALSVTNLGTAPADAAVQALCTKGTGGLDIADKSTGFRF